MQALVGGRAISPPGRPAPDQVALACPPDGGIAGHITHRVQVDGKAQRPQAHPGGGQGSLNPGVARPNDSDIILSGVISRHRSLSFGMIARLSGTLSRQASNSGGIVSRFPPCRKRWSTTSLLHLD